MAFQGETNFKSNMYKEVNLPLNNIYKTSLSSITFSFIWKMQ